MWLTSSLRCKLQWLITAAHLMKTIFYFLFFISTLSLSTFAFAQAGELSKQEAVVIATKNYPGRVLSVKRKTNVYQIKILSDSGKVRVIKVDVKNGNIQSRSGANAQDGSQPKR